MPGFIKKLTALPKDKQQPEIERALQSAIHRLLETDVFCVAASSTNAAHWKLKEFDIDSIAIDANAKEVDVMLTYLAVGEQLPGKPEFGNEVEGEAKAIIDDDGKAIFDDVSADIAG